MTNKMNKLIHLSSTIIVSIGIFVACKSTKSTTVTASPAKPSIVNKTGIITPTNEQVVAIQPKYPNVNLDELMEGYKLYTGTCTNCHGAKSIYKRSEAHWIDIIDDMAPKSELTEIQKKQLTKYIMSIKASQPSETK